MSRLASSTTPRARPSGLALQVLELGDDQQVVEELVDAHVLEGGDLAHDRVAAPGLGHEAVLGQLRGAPGCGSALSRSILLSATTIGTSAARAWLMASIGLGHDAVVGGDHEDHDVGGLGATGAHGGERLVARGVDEGDLPAVVLDLVGADVLGDATRLAGHDVGGPDAVEELGLAVVDVTHDGDDRWAPDGVVVLVVVEELDAQLLLQLDLLLLAGVDQADRGTDVGREQLDHVVGERLRGRDHLALLEQEADDVGDGAVELGAQLLGRRGAFDDDLALGDGRVGRGVGGRVERLELVAAATASALAALRGTTTGRTAGTTTGTAAGATTGTAAGTATRTATGTTGTGAHGRATGACTGTRGRARTGRATGAAGPPARTGPGPRPPRPGGGGMGLPVRDVGATPGGGGMGLPLGERARPDGVGGRRRTGGRGRRRCG